jgi:hypothetical protein
LILGIKPFYFMRILWDKIGKLLGISKEKREIKLIII